MMLFSFFLTHSLFIYILSIYIQKHNAQYRNHKHKVFDEVVNLHLKLLCTRLMKTLIGQEHIVNIQ